MTKETLGAHLRNLLTPYKNLLQLAKEGKADEETIRKYNLDNIDELIAFSYSEAMEQKHSQEPASEDLEEASEEYAYTNWESDDYHEGASEGKPFDAIGHTQKCFIDGAQWQKEQMMKDAIEGRLSSTVTGSKQCVSAYVGYGEYGKYGDRLKVIIIKE